MGNRRWLSRSGRCCCTVLAMASLTQGGRGEADRPRARRTRRDPARSSGESPTSMLETNTTCFWRRAISAARDRLFQLELWRRQATGTLAEIQGPRALLADVGARLLRFRGDMKRELNHYHPRGYEIVDGLCRGDQRLHRADRTRAGTAATGVQNPGDQARQMDAGSRGFAAQRAVPERDPGGAIRPARSPRGE